MSPVYSVGFGLALAAMARIPFVTSATVDLPIIFDNSYVSGDMQVLDETYVLLTGDFLSNHRLWLRLILVPRRLHTVLCSILGHHHLG
jgi:hypothetical protein